MTAITDNATILAQAAAPSGGPGGGTFMLVAYGLLFVAMYFFMIAPQRKKQKEHQKMLESLESGDEVMTAGGILGEVTHRKDDRVTVRIADGVKVEVAKAFITSVTKKSSKS